MIEYRVLRLRIIFLDTHDVQKLLNQSVDMLTTSDWILDEVQSGVNAQRVSWIDLLAIFASELSVLLQQLMQTGLYPAIKINIEYIEWQF